MLHFINYTFLVALCILSYHSCEECLRPFISAFLLEMVSHFQLLSHCANTTNRFQDLSLNQARLDGFLIAAPNLPPGLATIYVNATSVCPTNSQYILTIIFHEEDRECCDWKPRCDSVHHTSHNTPPLQSQVWHLQVHWATCFVWLPPNKFMVHFLLPIYVLLIHVHFMRALCFAHVHINMH